MLLFNHFNRIYLSKWDCLTVIASLNLLTTLSGFCFEWPLHKIRNGYVTRSDSAAESHPQLSADKTLRLV